MPTRRNTFCGKPECLHEWLVRSDATYARRKVFERDHGICAECGTDTEEIERRCNAPVTELRERWRAVLDALEGTITYPRDPVEIAAQDAEFDVWHRAYFAAERDAVAESDSLWRAAGVSRSAHRWEADHIRPVVEGGGSCGLDNLRTLCLPCHRRATAELAARRARQRREQVQPSLPMRGQS